jgi:hypothetical protein
MSDETNFAELVAADRKYQQHAHDFLVNELIPHFPNSGGTWNLMAESQMGQSEDISLLPNILQHTTRIPELEEITCLRGTRWFYDGVKGYQTRNPLKGSKDKQRPIEEITLELLDYSGEEGDWSWDIRRRFTNKNLYGIATLGRTLCGIDDQESMQIREYIIGLTDGSSATSIRHRDRTLTVLADVLDGLIGVDSDQAWSMRERIYTRVSQIQAVLENSDKSPLNDELRGFINDFEWGLPGVDSDRSWDFRNRVLGGDMNRMLRTVSCVDSERSWQLRQQVMESATITEANLDALMTSLAGLDSQRAWDMRQWIVDHTDPAPFFPTLARHVYYGDRLGIRNFKLAGQL